MATVVKSCTARLRILPCQRKLVCIIVETETLRNKENNSKIEVQIGCEEEQSPDNHVNNPEKSDDNIVMFSKQLERFR